jgi:hypothetical protein
MTHLMRVGGSGIGAVLWGALMPFLYCGLLGSDGRKKLPEGHTKKLPLRKRATKM